MRREAETEIDCSACSGGADDEKDLGMKESASKVACHSDRMMKL